MTKPQIIGILNVTPDSFFDGGNFFSLDAALAHGHKLIAQGADVIDVGGESTRPGAEYVSVAEECARVIDVVQELARHIRVSIDTTKPQVARAALDAGAQILNDVQGLQNPQMMELASDFKEVVIMHSRGTPQTMQALTKYHNIVEEVWDFFAQQIQYCKAPTIWLDPGIGFAKTAKQSCTLLKDLKRFHTLGHPLYVGASRKSFIKHSLNLSADEDRLGGSLAALVVGFQNGAQAFRVHDVKESKQLLDMLMVLKNTI